MACRVQKRISTMRRKLHILKALASFNSAKRTTVEKASILYIYKLKVALDSVKREYEKLVAIRSEYLNLLNHVQDNKNVKVEKINTATFVVSVTCHKRSDKLVTILEAFDELSLNVEQAKVSCENGFSMDAIVVAGDQKLDVRDVTEALLKAIGKESDQKDSAKA